MTQQNRRTAERIKAINKYLGSTGTFRYNVVTGKIESCGKQMSQFNEMTDYEINTLSVKLAERNIQCSSAKLKEILESSITPRFNPFHNYLEKLPPWDGATDYIKKLSETVETSNRELWEKSFKKWIVALVGSLLNDEVINHTVLIFSGRQGIGKSTWLLKLIPPELQRYYYSGTIKISSKDTLIMLSESMLINLEELGYLGNKELNELKEIITKPNVTFRRPYGRFNETLPRRASFAGSLNDKEFLSDTTGSRRFLSFEVTSIDYLKKVDLVNIYSQAQALFKAGFKFWFDRGDIDVINKNNEQFRIKSVEEELLMATFEPGSENVYSYLLTASEVLDHLNRKYKMQLTNASVQRLGKALKGNKFMRVKKGGKQLYVLKEVDHEKAEYLRRAKFQSEDD